MEVVGAVFVEPGMDEVGEGKVLGNRNAMLRTAKAGVAAH